jgi:H3 lysine-79-specific histone-lysine N-methyltransferase
MFKNSRIKPAPTKVRVEQAPAAKKPTPLPSKLAETSRKQQIARSAASSARSSPAISNARSSPATSPSEGYETSSRLKVPKRKPARQASPADRPKFDSDDDDEDSTSSEQPAQKRQKLQVRVVDPKRQIRSRKAFSETDGGKFEMIHAADIAADIAAKAKKSKAMVDMENDIVELQYPSASQRERYGTHSLLGLRSTS